MAGFRNAVNPTASRGWRNSGEGRQRLREGRRRKRSRYNASDIESPFPPALFDAT